MGNYYRIRTNVGKDQVVKAKLTQDVDFLEILSLKIKQEDTYKLHVSNYGVIVGRVLANDSFGIPNAKVSVFIPLSDEDKLNNELLNLYPYVDIQTKDSSNRRYNLLPDSSTDKCYSVVGSFPNKRLVLDNNIEIEIFEKYWKYTTVTNKSGDYMIFGVPTGSHQIHVDVDLSDIGILSQKPRDFIYKGYNITQFDNANQFKNSTNLDNLSQLLSQNSSVYVYPFWGDTDVEEIAITRCDLQVQYKFEPTCVFFGCIVSDNFSNNIGDKCNPSKYVGFNRNLVAGEGTIEMIRKTQDGLIEEFQIQGNRLIDGNGVWCYQIPMNLDYVGTDEFGNIVPTDDPQKGIPTRTSVRFRVSMQETNSEGVARHRAKYLIPNVQQVVQTSNGVEIANPNTYLQCYEFGSATPDEYFRDLYWNKVYSVKNYIPRIQLGSSKNTQKYSAIRTVNSSGNLNPFPFNHARFRLFFAYRVLCILMTIVAAILCGLNTLISFLPSKCLKLPLIGSICLFGWICDIVKCISMSGGLSEDEDSNVEYFPCCDRKAKNCMKCSESGCVKETSHSALMNVVQQSLSQEYDTVNLDFYNDWINGCLYLPLWFWKKTKKKKYLFGLFTKKAVNRYCNCDSNYSKLRITENCSLHVDDDYYVTDSDKSKKFHYQFPKNPTKVGHGIIKEVENNAGLKIYYYSPGVPTTNDYRDTTATTVPYVRLYSTDIILLGSLNDCDLDNLPRPFLNIPSSTANIPYIATLKDDATDSEDTIEQGGTNNETGVVEVTGMDWLGSNVNNGLLMDLTCVKVNTKPKTCINLSRMSELGVSLDSRYFDAISDGNNLKYDNERPADGLITRYEIIDNETRAMFASLNHNGLTDKVYNPNTGYDTYKLIYNYPIDFDGHLKKFAPSYTNKLKVKTYDNQDKAYVDFKFGIVNNKCRKHFYSDANSSSKKQMPLFNNSFYFYFGLNEGNTAIDKFNNLFYAECFKNNKYPFTLLYDTTPAKWCKKYDNANNLLTVDEAEIEEQKPNSIITNSYGTINITLNGIKVPYEYTLYNELNVEILHENDLYSSELKFGYEIENGQFTDKKNGIIKYINDGSYATYEYNGQEYVYLLDNGNYYINITDFNGNNIKQNITINQSPIAANLTVYGLGNKYYDGITQENDICNNYAYYGEIIVNSINIDGKDYKIISSGNTGNQYVTNGDGYILQCEYSENDYKMSSSVFLQIEPLFEESGTSLDFADCSCSNDYKEYIDANGALHFNIWRPGDYKLTITQFCPNKDNVYILNDNITSETVQVANGKPFLTFLNDVPLSFIIGKGATYNNVFYSPKVATSADESTVSGWFGVHDENNYKFEPVSGENHINVWADYVDTEFSTDGLGNVSDISMETKLDILAYKFDCLFNMASTIYIDNNEDKSITINSSGGKSPILYRGGYPNYSEFSSDNTSKNKFNTVIYDSDGTVTCNSNTANIVGLNYTEFNEKNNSWQRVSNVQKRFNDLFGDSTHIGNYFAAFTMNGGCKYEEESGSWKSDPTIRFESSPNGSGPFVPDSNGLGGVNPGDSIITQDYKSELSFMYNNNPYLRALTIDRRLDYAYFIMLPYNLTDLDAISSDSIWKNGRMVGYQYNGIEMAYDNSYNIVSTSQMSNEASENKYEYYLPVISENSPSCFGSNGEKLSIKYNNNIQNKRLYSCKLVCGKSFDIRDRFWAENKIVNTNSLNDALFTDYTNKCEDVNGEFSQTNYPTVRKLDIYNLPSATRLTYTAQSCRYESELEMTEKNDGSYGLSCEITGSDETTFTISSNNIVFSNNTLDEAIDNVESNTKYTYDILDKCFNVSHIKINFKLNYDSSNNTHQSFTYLPFIKMFKVSSIPFEAIKTIPLTGNTIGSGLNTLLDDVLDGINGAQFEKSNVVTATTDFFKQVKIVTTELPNDVFGLKLRRFVSSQNNNSVLYDDDSLIQNVSYLVNRDVSNNDIFSVYYLRRYINNDGDNLSKDILTLNIGTLMDIRKIYMSVECTIENNLQVTTFTINNQMANVNTQFANEGITVGLRYSKKKSSFATAELQANSNLVAKIVWDGELSETKLSQTLKPIEVYWQLNNSLIYMLSFMLNNRGEMFF